MTALSAQDASNHMLEVPFHRLSHGKGLPLPFFATSQSAGMDLMAAIPEGETLTLNPLQRVLVPVGFSMALPAGFEAQIRPRSGLAFKHGITVLNAPGTIDADYRGEVKVLLVNLGEAPFTVERGMRIAQMVVAAYANVEWAISETPLEENDRGGGFGSTGLKERTKLKEVTE